MLQVLSWIAVACYMGGIWWLSSRGAELTARVDATGVSDLSAHLILFGGLSLLLRLALWSSWPERPGIWLGGIAAAGAFGYGLIDELHQHFVPGRGTDAQDLLGNLVGAVGAQVLVTAVVWISRLL